MRRTRRPHLRALLLLLAVTLPPFVAPPAEAQSDPLARGVRLFEQERYAEARQALEPLATGDPRNARAAYYLGRSYLGEGDADRAVQWLERAVRADASTAEYHLHLGNAYGQKAMRANVLQQARLARRAKGSFERAVALDPRSIDAHFGLVRFHTLAPGVMGGDKRVARQHAEAIGRLNGYRGAHAMAVVMQAEGNVEGAIQSYQGALRQYPDSVDVYFALGGLLGQQQQREMEALEVYESLLRRQVGQEHRLSALYQVGRLGAITGQRLERAEEALRLPPVDSAPGAASARRRPLAAGDGAGEAGEDRRGPRGVQRRAGAGPRAQGVARGAAAAGERGRLRRGGAACPAGGEGSSSRRSPRAHPFRSPI